MATTAFLGEAVPLQAAGAFALGNMLRNPGAAIAAVVYPPLVRRMGVGWFFTGFALLDLFVVGGAVMGTFTTFLDEWSDAATDFSAGRM